MCKTVGYLCSKIDLYTIQDNSYSYSYVILRSKEHEWTLSHSNERGSTHNPIKIDEYDTLLSVYSVDVLEYVHSYLHILIHLRLCKQANSVLTFTCNHKVSI